MSVERQIEDALQTEHPLHRLAVLQSAARRIDQLRTEVARLKVLTSVQCSEARVTQLEMAEASNVSPAMVQQWVKRGRELLAEESLHDA